MAQAQRGGPVLQDKHRELKAISGARLCTSRTLISIRAFGHSFAQFLHLSQRIECLARSYCTPLISLVFPNEVLSALIIAKSRSLKVCI